MILSLIFKGKKPVYDKGSGNSDDEKPNQRFCPLCHEALKKGQNLKSVVYPGSENSPDKITEIYGCPNCYPANKRTVRICPVCKKPVADEGFVIARMFDKATRIHVHVLGCTTCYKRH